MTITAVGSAYAASTSGGSGFSVYAAPTALGDILVCWVMYNGGTVAGSVSVSGGGVTTWNTARSSVYGTSTEAAIFWGIVTTTGVSSVSVSAGGSGTAAGAITQQFHSDTGGTWALDVSNVSAASLVTSGNMVSLTPTGSGELYLGCVATNGGGSSNASGSTAGFTYKAGALYASWYSVACWNASVSNPTAYSPNWTLNGSPSAGDALTVAAILQCPAAPVATTQIVMVC